MFSHQSISQQIELKRLERKMNLATTYREWVELAEAHDLLSGADQWKQKEDSQLFDARQIRQRYRILKENCEREDDEEVLFALNEGIHGNMGGMGKAALYEQAMLGTKNLIDKYVELIKVALRRVADAPTTVISFEEKLDFFRRASHCYGRSALALSGGGGLIYFHHGVVHTLIEQDLLPNVISGSSAGAWMCAQLGTRNDKELKNYFLNKRYAFRTLYNYREMLGLISGTARPAVENERDDLIDEFLDSITFQEAFEHTGRYINIPIAPAEQHQNSRLMNAIASPNVTIRSAVRASSSVPGLSEPVALEAKDSKGRIKAYLRNRRWVDGSFAEDLPFKRLSRLFGVNHFIVSMINPFVLPFLRRDPKIEPDSVLNSFRAISLVATRESIRMVRRWMTPFGRNSADALLGTIYNLVDQDYVGDINIFLDQKYITRRKAFFEYRDESEIETLITAGRRATWPKLDQIRNATSISHVIDGILSEMDQEAVIQPHERTKRRITA